MTNKNYFLITGSSSGLGENLVKVLNEKGLKTIGIDINEGRNTDIVVDLASISMDDIEKIKVKLENSKIDSIIHCAAVQKNPQKNLSNISKTFDEVFSVNTKSIYVLIEMLESEFSEFSSICVVSSVHAIATTVNNTLYASSKSALRGLIQGLTLEKQDKMSIFELILGAMDSPKLLNSVNEKEVNDLKNQLPSKKILQPEEVSNLIIDLLIKHRSILHGSSIVIDNGVLSQLSTN